MLSKMAQITSIFIIMRNSRVQKGYLMKSLMRQVTKSKVPQGIIRYILIRFVTNGM